MLGTFAGLAWSRLRHRWRLGLARCLGLALAVALALTIALTQALAADAGFATLLRGIGPRGVVTIERPATRDAAGYAAFQGEVRNRVARELGAALRPQARYLASGGMRPITLNGGLLQPDLSLTPGVAWYADAERHVTVTAGAWPAGSPSGGVWPVAAAAAGAELLAVRPGDVLCLRPAGTTPRLACVRIAALWRPIDGADPYWGAGVPSLTFQVPEPEMLALAAAFPALPVRAGALLTPVPAGIPYERAGATAAAINRLRGAFGLGNGDYFATGLDDAIGGYVSAAQDRALSIELVAAQALGVTAAFVAVTAATAMAEQRRVLGAWQSRGWSRGRAWALLLVEELALLALAVPAGAALAVAAVTVLGRASLGAGPPGPATLVGAGAPPLGLAVAALAAILAALAWRATAPAGADLRAPGGPAAAWWRWRGLDLWLAAAAAAYLLVGRLGAGLTLGGAADLALPLLAAVVLAVAGLRLLPLAGRAAATARTGVAGHLASIQLRRGSGEHGRLALLLALAIGLGVFAGVYAGSTAGDAADQAAYRAGGDVRALLTDGVGPARLDEARAGLPGVADTALTYRTQGIPTGTYIYEDVLGVEPESLAAVLASRPGAPGRPSQELLRSLEGADSGPALPAGTREIGVWADSAGLDGELVADVAAPGWSCACPLGRLDVAGWRRLAAPVRPPPGARVTGLEVHALPGADHLTGTVALSDLAAAGPDGRTAVLESFGRPAGWWRAADGTGEDVADLAPDLTAPRDGRPTTAFAVELDLGPAAVRPAPGTAPVPCLVSASLLHRLGLAVGQPFLLDVRSVQVRMVAVAAVNWFPTLFPSVNEFLVASREPLLARLAHEGDGHAWPNELWLRLSGPSGPVVQALRQRGDVVDLEDRGALLDAAEADPFRRALVANLALGFATAALLAVCAFGLHFFAFARGRSGDYAVLRANGLTRAGVSRELALSEAAVLAVSLPVGCLVGGLAAWTLLPLPGTPQPGPPPALAADPLLLGAGLAAVLALSAAAGWLAGSLGSRVRLVDELRAIG
jgi:FtsX-like permease family